MASSDNKPLKQPAPPAPTDLREAAPKPPPDDTDRDAIMSTDAQTQPIIKAK